MGMTTDQLTYARMLLSDPGSSAVQSIQLENAAGGTFTITFSGQTTTPITYGAGANDVQNALAALPNVGVGNVSVQLQTGVPQASFYTVYFVGTLGNVAQPMLTVNTSGLTGIGIIVQVQQVAAGGVLAFTDTELNLLYSEAFTNFYRTIEYGYLALIADQSRLHDYVAGQSQEKMSQVTQHLREQVDYYHQQANASQQLQIVSLKSAPPRIVAVPVTSGVPATSLQYSGRRGGPFGRGGWPWGNG